MKLQKFRIKNYKSIKDSGYCWLASDLTVLAGKNESGKTAILEALRDFDIECKSISDTTIPLEAAYNGKAIIELCFKIDKLELEEIASKISITITEELLSHVTGNGITVLKEKDGSYILDDQLQTVLDSQTQETNKECIEKIKLLIKIVKKHKELTNLADPRITDDIANTRQSILDFLVQVVPLIAAIPEGADRRQIDDDLNAINVEVENLQTSSIPKSFLGEIIKCIPNFTFFSDFTDILPFEVSFAEAKSKKPIQDFAKVANLDLDKVIQETDTQRRMNLLSNCSAIISGNFMNYWGQNRLELVAKPDGEKLILGVSEEGKTILFKPEQRSKGFQWFLSFYLRLNAEKDNTKIILIDEPGLYLHAKAQEDILKVLEEVAKKSQLIFSTHSPYLIDPDRLDRVCLVIKDDKGTKIENKIHKGADKETLTPIITAIGLDLSKEFSIVGKKNVVLEGITDYYYFQALKRLLPETTSGMDVNLIPCCGASKVPQIVSLLIGWNLEFVSALDNDTEGKRTAKELREKLQIDEKRIIPISVQDKYSIEDLFTREDFNSFILDGQKGNDQNTLNSKFLKDNGIDKVLLAKLFLDKIKKDALKQVKLSQASLDNFRMVFENIGKCFVKQNSL